MLGSTWRLIGRVLISLILFTSAIEKLQHSTLFRQDFTTSIDHINSLASQVGLSLPDVSLK